MKAIAVAILAFATSLYAQAPTRTPHQPPPPHATPTAQAPPASVEPKESIATANLKAVEAEKLTLVGQQQLIVQQANSQLGSIREKIAEKDAAAATLQDEIRKDEGWGPEVVYTPPQQMPDGSSTAGGWHKNPKK